MTMFRIALLEDGTERKLFSLSVFVTLIATVVLSATVALWAFSVVNIRSIAHESDAFVLRSRHVALSHAIELAGTELLGGLMLVGNMTDLYLSGFTTAVEPPCGIIPGSSVVTVMKGNTVTEHWCADGSRHVRTVSTSTPSLRVSHPECTGSLVMFPDSNYSSFMASPTSRHPMADPYRISQTPTEWAAFCHNDITIFARVQLRDRCSVCLDVEAHVKGAALTVRRLPKTHAGCAWFALADSIYDHNIEIFASQDMMDVCTRLVAAVSIVNADEALLEFSSSTHHRYATVVRPLSTADPTNYALITVHSGSSPWLLTEFIITIAVNTVAVGCLLLSSRMLIKGLQSLTMRLYVASRAVDLEAEPSTAQLAEPFEKFLDWYEAQWVSEVHSIASQLALLYTNLRHCKDFEPHALRVARQNNATGDGVCAESLESSMASSVGTIHVVAGSMVRTGSMSYAANPLDKKMSMSSMATSGVAHGPLATSRRSSIMTYSLLSVKRTKLAERDVTVVWLNILGFHHYCTGIRWEEGYDTYLAVIARQASKTGGVVDVVLGDRVCVTFNAAQTVEDHFARAAQFAAQEAYVQELPGMHVKAGIASGVVYCGTVGGSWVNRFNIFGHVPRLAASLCSMNKELGSSILTPLHCLPPDCGAVNPRLIAISDVPESVVSSDLGVTAVNSIHGSTTCTMGICDLADPRAVNFDQLMIVNEVAVKTYLRYQSNDRTLLGQEQFETLAPDVDFTQAIPPLQTVLTKLKSDGELDDPLSLPIPLEDNEDGENQQKTEVPQRIVHDVVETIKNQQLKTVEYPTY